MIDEIVNPAIDLEMLLFTQNQIDFARSIFIVTIVSRRNPDIAQTISICVVACNTITSIITRIRRNSVVPTPRMFMSRPGLSYVRPATASGAGNAFSAIIRLRQTKHNPSVGLETHGSEVVYSAFTVFCGGTA